MEIFIKVAPLVCGVYMVGLALMLNTENIHSAIVFKVIPFFLGTSILFTGAKLFGWI